jgi:hypothetical protein
VSDVAAELDGRSLLLSSEPAVDAQRLSAMLDGGIDGEDRDAAVEELANASDAVLSAYCDAVHVVREAETPRTRVPSCSPFSDGYFGSGCW